MPLRGMPLRGAPGRAPPPVCRAEILKNFRGKSVPENYTLFSRKKKRFLSFYLSKRSGTYLERQISTRIIRDEIIRGALGRAPPPVCRAEILKKIRGKRVPENYTLFFWKNTFSDIVPLKTLWDLSRTTDLDENNPGRDNPGRAGPGPPSRV